MRLELLRFAKIVIPTIGLRNYLLYTLILFCSSFFLSSCNPTRHIAKDEYLLAKNTISVDNSDIDTYDLEGILKQKANRKVGPMRFHLWVYNSAKPEKLERKVVKKQIRINKRNMKRMSQGRDSIPYDATFIEWRKYTVGEAPVVMDTNLIKKSEEQLHLYLIKLGYRRNEVSVKLDTVGMRKNGSHKHEIKVTYDIKAGPAYTIREFHVKSKDERIRKAVLKSAYDIRKASSLQTKLTGQDTITNVFTLIEVGAPLDLYLLDEERTRITRYLKDNAYWKFNREYISFNADTTKYPGEVVLTMRIDQVNVPNPLYDSLPPTKENHKVYRIRKVTFVTDYKPGEDRYTVRDTLFHRGPQGKEHYFLYQGDLNVDPDMLIQSNFLRVQGWWKQKYVERSYKRISELGIYKNVNIEFIEVETDGGMPLLDVIYILTPAKQKSFTIQGDGTHQGGFLGISGSFDFLNKNPFGHAENLKISFQGGIEAQQTVTENDATTDGSSGIIDPVLNSFNTVEFGPEVSLTIPKFLFVPLSLDQQSRSAMPFTVLSGKFNYQRRPDYTRQILHAGLAYKWYETKTKRHEFHPLEISEVKINKSEAFQTRLDTLNDAFLTNSYQDHLILAPSYTLTYNSQQSLKIIDRSNRYYYQGRVEAAGNLLRRLSELSGAQTDSLNTYSLLNIRFAQYLLIDNDFRYYRTFSKRHSLATRVAAGVGFPFANSPSLPFEKSFFAGGANGIRAWKSRSIGPGSFFDPDQTFDKIGDVRLEASVEYRFDFISFIEGALFVDAGNIWLLNDDSDLTGREFNTSTFYREIAVGAGLGARFDFSFFIVRLDAGIPLKNPSLPVNERWIWQDKPIYDTWDDNSKRYAINLNLGIGYPF